MKSIAILLTCHNRREKTLACFNALYNCILPENFVFEVYLVDDGSTDGTGEAVKKNYPQINVIQGNGNLYWNRGMRLAWETAAKAKDYDFYLWLNDDTIVFENALEILLGKAKITERKQILVGATCSKESNAITYGAFNYYSTKVFPNGEWQPCDYFNGNIVLIPQIVYQKIGLLDSRFHHYIGDFDYGLRAKKMGFIHLLSPVALGFCESHTAEPIWRNTKVSLFKRFRHLYIPLGNNPMELFIFEKRHSGLFLAFVHFFSVHIRAIVPQIWQKKSR